MRTTTCSRLASVLAAGVLSGGLAACGDDKPRGAASDQKAVAPAPTAEAPTPTPETPEVVRGKLGRPTTISSKANLFGAGREEPPNPGGGGGGEPPPVWRLPKGSGRVVTVPSATGAITPAVDYFPLNGPAGSKGDNGPTDISSYGGISGIVHRRNGLFLAGVFLTDDPPSKPAPPRLDFTNRERFKSLAPQIGQSFLIGDGKGRSFRVPPRATRLFLGLTDAFLYKGPPGWYGNNAGSLSVTVKMAGG